MKNWFIVTNLDEFVNKARSIVFNNFGKWAENPIDALLDDVIESEQEELNDILSLQESLVIVKTFLRKQHHKKTGEIRYIINEKIFADIVYSLNDRMVSNILTNLVQKGLVESAFDNESNDFVFWIKDDEKDENNNPETD